MDASITDPASESVIPLPVTAEADAVGEILRLLIFGPAPGGYTKFGPVLPATDWDDARRERAIRQDLGRAGEEDHGYWMCHSRGFTCRVGSVIVEVWTYWGHDSILLFQLKTADGPVLRTLVNFDCEKATWTELDDQFIY